MSAHHWLPVPKGVDLKIDSWLLGFGSAVKMVFVNRYPKRCLEDCHSRSVGMEEECLEPQCLLLPRAFCLLFSRLPRKGRELWLGVQVSWCWN